MNREEMTKRARALRIATSDVEHLDDRAFGAVVATRTHNTTRDRARQLTELIQFSADLPWDEVSGLMGSDASAAALDAIDELHALIDALVPTAS